MTSKDPHSQREAKKYDKPIASREFIMELLEQKDGPASHMQLVRELNLQDEGDIEALRRRLRAMERDGQLISNRRGAYGLIEKMDLIRGRVQGHKDGFGFLIPEDGSDDLFLSGKQMRLAMDGDRVIARVAGIDRKGRREGAIVEVFEHHLKQVIGRYFEESGIAFVMPDNKRITQDILIPKNVGLTAKQGQFVVAEIMEYAGKRNKTTAKVIEILGDHMAPGMEIDVAIRAHDIPHEWPDEVLKQVKKIPGQVVDEDLDGRVDMRKLPFVTIDGEDARDFDDAVYCKKKRLGGWTLSVAIADVSHYVKPGSALDDEADKRGTSVYFPEQVVPMLPEALSNGLCSLNPAVDRLTLVCEMTISSSGKVSKYKFSEAVIHSHARLTYNKVSSMLQAADSGEGKDLRAKYKPVVPYLESLYDLYKVLRKARDKRGAIDFETTETRIVFGEDRKIDAIVPVTRNDAHKIIEECMLCANVCAATFLDKHDIPGLYRVHDGPKEEKLTNLKEFLFELGLSLGGGADPSPRDYQALLQKIGDRPDARLIQTVMLRSLSQAVYHPENDGHFGLGYEAYAHFTSPIRRYPDLLVHRALRHVIRSEIPSKHVERVKGVEPIAKKKIYPYDTEAMVALGASCSVAERRADMATRDVVDWLKCEFVQDRVGETFQGVITTVTGFGFFVELSDVFVEGLVHITSLSSDYYHFDPVKHRLVGEKSGVSYRLGDPVEVIVAQVNLDDRKIDFELVSSPTTRSRKNSNAPDKPYVKTKKKTAKKAGDKAPARKRKPKATLSAKELKALDKKKKAKKKAKTNKNPASPKVERSGVDKTTGAKPRRRKKTD